MKPIRRSYKCNKAKKDTLFKKGHKVNSKQTRNLPVTINDNATVSTTTQVNRLTTDDAAEIEFLSQNQSAPMTLPYKLRPLKTDPEKEVMEYNSDENIIINTQNLSDMVNLIHSQHCARSRMSVRITRRTGLCVVMSVICSSCHFKTEPMEMSQSIQKPRGPPASALNEMLALPIVKSKAGISDVLLVLSCLNIKAPSRQLLQTKVNELGHKVTHLNEQQMTSSQQHIREITTLAEMDNAVDIQIDTAFSSRPQGGCEKAQQSFAPAIEHTTSKHHVLSIATANKHCRKLSCDHSRCSKNYRQDASIASSERKLLQDNLHEISNARLVSIRSVTTDASAQVAKAIRDFCSSTGNKITHFTCFIHKMGSLEKHLRNMKLKSIPTKFDKAVYMQKLASTIRSRVRMELQNLRAMKVIDNVFIGRAISALENIVRCFSNKHSNCRNLSTVCKGHLDNYEPTFLPYGVHLQLNATDKNTLKTTISKVFNIPSLKALCQLFNTNMCESLHAAVFNYAPKSTCWSRNFPALCHSATLSRTMGRGYATLLLAKAAGVRLVKSSPMYIQLRRVDKNTKYHSMRKDTPAYKQARYYQRKKRCHKSLYKESVYGYASSTAAEDHSYGLTG